jgi:hypothetical protein
MGVYLSCFPIHCDADTISLAHVENHHQNNTEHSQYENKDTPQRRRNCPYPLPNDPAEIDR